MLNSVSFVLPWCFLNVSYQKFFTLKKQDKLLLDMNESKIFLGRIIRKIVFFTLFIYFSFDAKFFENGSKHWKWHSEFSDVWILKTFRFFFFFFISQKEKSKLLSMAFRSRLDLASVCFSDLKLTRHDPCHRKLQSHFMISNCVSFLNYDTVLV